MSYTTFRRAPIAVNRADISRVQVPRGRFRNVIKIERQEGDLILINAKPFDLKIIPEFLLTKLKARLIGKDFATWALGEPIQFRPKPSNRSQTRRVRP